jgi:hypothetical protein
VFGGGVVLVYAAALSSFVNTRLYIEHKDDFPHILESFHYLKKGAGVKVLNAYKSDGKRIFLDSGAFSAFTLGASISINEYANFILKHSGMLEVAANLDDLSKNREQAAKNTWRNQQELERLTGRNILPVFHCHEPEKYLVNLLDRYEYIALGGMVPESNRWLLGWLDRLFSNYLCDAQGRARIKVHGFGLTSTLLMFRYPFYSIDSTTWVNGGKFGMIFIPDEDTYSFTRVFISRNSPYQKEWGKHFDSLPPVIRKKVVRVVEDLGSSIEHLKDDYLARNLFNVRVMNKMSGLPAPIFNKHVAEDLFPC